MAYVDVNLLVDGYTGMKVALQDFQKQSTALNAEADSILSIWKGELMKYEKERSGMTDKEKKAREELLDMKGKQVSAVMEGTKRRVAEAEKKLTEQVFGRVNDFVKRYGKEKGYRIILGANGSGNILYAEESMDITKDVQEALNKEYEKGL